MKGGFACQLGVLGVYCQLGVLGPSGAPSRCPQNHPLPCQLFHIHGKTGKDNPAKQNPRPSRLGVSSKPTLYPHKTLLVTETTVRKTQLYRNFKATKLLFWGLRCEKECTGCRQYSINSNQKSLFSFTETSFLI